MCSDANWRWAEVRVAVFTPYFPYPSDTGGKIRSYNLLRALLQHYEVDLYVPYCGSAPASEHLAALSNCHEIHLLQLTKSWRKRDRLARVLAPLPRSVDFFYTEDTLAEVRALLARRDYQLLISDEICMTPYAELLPEVPRIVTRQKVDFLHYHEMAQQQPWGSEKVLDWLESQKLRRYEWRKMPLYQAAVVCSESDAAVIREQSPQAEILVVANGADLTQFTPVDNPPSGPPTLLYVGSMYYYPNVDAVKYFFEHCWAAIQAAVPEVQVQIVGHQPPSEIQALGELPGVMVTGSVPDVRPYYQSATALIVPLRLGGGTRLKIVEAMAMGVPVISTSVGAEGLSVVPDENIVIADSAVAFVRQTVRVLQDAVLRERLKVGGRTLAQRYDWTALAQPYVELVARLAGSDRA